MSITEGVSYLCGRAENVVCPFKIKTPPWKILSWYCLCKLYNLVYFNHLLLQLDVQSSCTQQNSYSISHLLGTVTTQRLPLWRCSHCSLIPDTMTTEQCLHQTRTLLGIHYHGAFVEICLVGNCTITTWEDTTYPLHTVTLYESRWHRYTVL